MIKGAVSNLIPFRLAHKIGAIPQYEAENNRRIVFKDLWARDREGTVRAELLMMKREDHEFWVAFWSVPQVAVRGKYLDYGPVKAKVANVNQRRQWRPGPQADKGLYARVLGDFGVRPEYPDKQPRPAGSNPRPEC